MNQIVFMHDGKVVCHIYGYPASNDFGLYVKGQNEGEPFVSINSTDHILLTPKQMKDAILLYQTEK